ncbi:MAG: putative DNA binding domain-containing protein, partial [Kiritimatiellia bacterium]
MTLTQIKNGESATLEFKELLPEQSIKYTKTAVAFANGSGGCIIFGVKNDTCEAVGIPRDRLFTDMDAITNAICDSCEPKIVPAVSFQEIDGKTLIVAEIEAGMQRPYYIRSQGIQQGTYFRAGATTRQVEPYMLQELILEGSGRSLDSIVYKNDTVSNEVVEALCHSMTEYAMSHCLNDTERAKIHPLSKNQLCMWGLLSEQKGSLRPTLGFKLLAGLPMPEILSEIQCGVFKGRNRTIFVNRQEYEGSLFKQVDDAYDFVLRMIRVGAKIEGVQRQDVYEFPLGTIRELIVNAICHRSYLRPSHIQVALYDDRLEITSPGMLSRDLTIERLKEGYSVPQNKAIAKAFAYMNLIEGWGSGIPRII